MVELSWSLVELMKQAVITSSRLRSYTPVGQQPASHHASLGFCQWLRFEAQHARWARPSSFRTGFLDVSQSPEVRLSGLGQPFAERPGQSVVRWTHPRCLLFNKTGLTLQVAERVERVDLGRREKPLASSTGPPGRTCRPVVGLISRR